MTCSTRGRERRQAEPGAGRGPRGSEGPGALWRRRWPPGTSHQRVRRVWLLEGMVPLPEGHGRPEKPVDKRVREGLGKTCRSRGKGVGGERG